MKFSTTVTAASLLLSTNAPSIAFAFAPTQSFTTATTQRVQSSSRLSLLPPVDPIFEASSSIVTSSGGDLVEALGQLALLGSVGFGVAMGNINNPDWSYEYKVGNEYSNSDLAMIGESDTSVLEKVEEETKEEVKTSPPPAAIVEEPVKKEPEPVPVVTAEPGNATVPSKELLESTEKAKAEVQKKGIQETKDKISSKSSAATKDATTTTTTPPVEEKEKKESTEVAKTTKKSGGKRRIAKGVTLIVAAGAVALARNVVKAYLGRTIL